MRTPFAPPSNWFAALGWTCEIAPVHRQRYARPVRAGARDGVEAPHPVADRHRRRRVGGGAHARYHVASVAGRRDPRRAPRAPRRQSPRVHGAFLLRIKILAVCILSELTTPRTVLEQFHVTDTTLQAVALVGTVVTSKVPLCKLLEYTLNSRELQLVNSSLVYPPLTRDRVCRVGL